MFHHYGGRGITVCESWHKFENFRDWALANGYQDGLTLERIDNNGNYEPENCRYIPQKHQLRNRRTTIHINSLQTVSSFSEVHAVPYDYVWHTLKFYQKYPDAWNAFISCLSLDS